MIDSGHARQARDIGDDCLLKFDRDLHTERIGMAGQLKHCYGGDYGGLQRPIQQNAKGVFLTVRVNVVPSCLSSTHIITRVVSATRWLTLTDTPGKKPFPSRCTLED